MSVLNSTQPEFNTEVTSSKNTNRLLLVGAAAFSLTIVLVVLFFLFQKSSTSNPTAPGSSPTPQQTVTGNPVIPGRTKLLNSVYAPLAHQIFPGPISASDAASIKGYSISTTPQPDGSTMLKATPGVFGYSPIEVTLKPGQKAYFVITTTVAELATNKEVDLGDNFIIIVDKNGAIIKNL